MAKHTTAYNRLVTVAVAFGSLVSDYFVLQRTMLKHPWTYGYCSSVIGSTIGQPGWYNFFDLPMQGESGYGTTTTQTISTANGIYSAGGAIGTLFIMWAATALGRKRSIQTGGAFALLGGALQGGAANLG